MKRDNIYIWKLNFYNYFRFQLYRKLSLSRPILFHIEVQENGLNIFYLVVVFSVGFQNTNSTVQVEILTPQKETFYYEV